MVCVQTTTCYHKVNRLGKWLHYFMMVTGILELILSCSDFCVLVWHPCRYFITLSDIIRICGHVIDVVIMNRGMFFFLCLCWNFLLCIICVSLCHFIPRCNKLNLGMIFFLVFANIFVLVRFCLIWHRFISWCNQLHLGMIFLRLACLLWLSVILSDFVSFHILVRLTESWCGVCLGVMKFSVPTFLFLHTDLQFPHVFETSWTWIKVVALM